MNKGMVTFTVWMVSLWMVLMINGYQNRVDLHSIKQEIIKLQEIQKK
jgi:hypothetical protein